MVKHCWLLVLGRRDYRERGLKAVSGWVFEKLLACSVSRRIITLISCLCLKDQLGLCSLNFHTHAITGNCSANLPVLAYSLQVASVMRGNPP